MEEFLNRLYNYEYFGTYLLISIAVLILLFIIVLFFGKKDQKNRELEATKKLQQINVDDAFKEDTLGDTVEVPITNNEETLDNTIAVPQIDVLNTDNNLNNNEEIISNASDLNNDDVNSSLESLNEVIPPIDSSVDMAVDMTAKDSSLDSISPFVKKEFESIKNNPVNENEEESINKEEVISPEPILEKEEEKPFAFESFDVGDTPSVPEFDFDKIIRDIEESKKELMAEEKQAPEEDFVILKPESDDKVEEKTSSPENVIQSRPEVFSSVFVNNEEPEISKPVEDDENEEDFELPALKEDVKVENKFESNISMPSINDLSGETYNIK